MLTILGLFIIFCFVYAVFEFIHTLIKMAKEEKYRKIKEKEYLASIEHYKKTSMFLYEHHLDMNPYKRERYFLHRLKHNPNDFDL